MLMSFCYTIEPLLSNKSSYKDTNLTCIILYYIKVNVSTEKDTQSKIEPEKL